MLVSTIFLIIILAVNAVKAGLFIAGYGRLLRSGIQTAGRIVSVEISRSFITKNGTIPIVSFVTTDNKPVIGKPLLSWVFEVNNYLNQKECIVCYNKLRPEKFVVKSNVEVFVNIAIIIITLSLVIILLTNRV